MTPWFVWLLLALPLIILAVGLPLVKTGYFDMPTKPQHHLDADPLAEALAAKKARRLAERREWEQQFYQIHDEQNLILYNGVVMTMEEADQLHLIEESKRRNE